jgi:hypothetical protein
MFWQNSMNCFVFQFNRLFGKLSLFFLTFVFGTAITLLLRVENSPPKIIDNSPPKVTLCQLVQNPENYDGKIVRVEADASDFDGEPFIFDKTCKSLRSNIGVERVQGYELADEELMKFLAQADLKTPVRVLLTGKFDADAKFMCFGWKFGIQVTDVELQPINHKE